MNLFYFFAAIAYLLQIGLFVALHVRGTYSLSSHAVSDYGVGPTRRLFAAYGLAGMGAGALLAVAILAGGRFPVTAGLYLLGMATLRLGVLCFPTDLEGDRLTRNGKLHYLFAVFSFALAYMAIDALHPAALLSVAEWVRPVLGALRWVVILSLAGVVVCLIPSLRRIFGLVERVFLLSVMIWLLVFAVAVAGQ